MIGGETIAVAMKKEDFSWKVTSIDKKMVK